MNRDGTTAASPLIDAAQFVKRGSPKIGGSVVGFIVLVVVLVLVIIISGTAVVYLLRENMTSDKRLRRQRKKYPTQSMPYSIPFNCPSRPPTSRLERLRKLFTIRSTDVAEDADIHSRIKMGRGGVDGWLPAGSGSDWSESIDDLPRSRGESTPAGGMRGLSSPLASPRSILSRQSSPSPQISSLASDSSTSLSVRFDLHGVRGLPYPDKFAPSPHTSRPIVHSQLSSSSSSSSPSLSPVRTRSPEPMPGSPQNVNGLARQFATQSGTSMHTFESGTKFIEAL
ncbi:hypothetical protein BDQ12DRAFT_689053 [Crucibulum laeve]|uniref:Uncharacterized protein n=1 Tax=Crucibulum laeve TaxID=68775 RepID=A0A5C3LS84_9AGAR|nr:hypothetical protein BDQ12DRAFT_689053 [Crucibulum laeve]